jgi:hypothetical protein
MSTATSPFKMSASNSEGGNFELPQSGMYPAVLVGIIDLGTTTKTFGADSYERHGIYLCWELTAEFDSKGQPFIVAKDYTWSLNKKAKLRAIVEPFIGRTLADGEEYDLLELLGKPCMLSLTEGTSGSGKKYVDVSSVGKPPKGMTVPPHSKELCGFAIAMLSSNKDDTNIPSWVPPLYGKDVVDEIKRSREFGNLPAF